MRRLGVVAAFLVVLGGAATAASVSTAGPPLKRPGPDATVEERLTFDVTFLAADDLEGREAGKRGHDFAAQIVAQRFRELALEPAAGDGRYLQHVPMELFRRKYRRGGIRFFIAGDEFPPGTEIVGRTRQLDVTIAHAPIVFAGWGLVSETYGRDDYAGLDVEGAIVVALHGAPRFIPSDARAYYTAIQARTAAERGAAALITVLPRHYEREVAAFPRFARHFLESQHLAWVGPNGVPANDAPGLQARAVMGEAGARRLFDKTAYSWDVIANAADAPIGNLPAFDLGIVGSMKLGARPSRVASYNILGAVRGTDPALAGEAVLVTAHLDHRGMRERDGAMALNNGAVDNASGVAVLMELARALKQDPPARTVVFAAVTGHEAGLVGSDYIAGLGLPGGREIVANVNLDAPLATFPFVDMVPHGAGRTSLGPVVADILARHGVAASKDRSPDHGVFARSDHFSFVRRGIPSVYITMGLGGAGAEAFEEFQSDHRHRPSDDVELIMFDQLARYTAIHADLVRATADSPQRPYWLQGDFFAEITGGPSGPNPVPAVAEADAEAGTASSPPVVVGPLGP